MRRQIARFAMAEAIPSRATVQTAAAAFATMECCMAPPWGIARMAVASSIRRIGLRVREDQLPALSRNIRPVTTYRILARIEDGKVRLFTRNGNDPTAKMPRLVKDAAGSRSRTPGVESAAGRLYCHCTRSHATRRSDTTRNYGDGGRLGLVRLGVGPIGEPPHHCGPLGHEIAA